MTPPYLDFTEVSVIALSRFCSSLSDWLTRCCQLKNRFAKIKTSNNAESTMRWIFTFFFHLCVQVAPFVLKIAQQAFHMVLRVSVPGYTLALLSPPSLNDINRSVHRFKLTLKEKK